MVTGRQDLSPGRGPLRPLLRLSAPLIVVNLGNQLMGVVDTALAGRVDRLTLAATGLGSTVFFFISILGIGITMGVDPLASQAFGAGRDRFARRAMWQGLYVAAIVVVPLALATVLLTWNLEGFGVGSELATMTRSYVFPRLISLLPVLGITTLRAYLQAAHRTRSIWIAVIAGNVINFIGDWILLFGDDGLRDLGLPAVGLPSFGVAGIAWASSFASTVKLAILAGGVDCISVGAGIEPLRSADTALLRRVFGLGFPIGLHMFVEGGAYSIAGVIAGTLGTEVMAAHQVVCVISTLTYMVPLGISMATSVQVGRAVGGGDTLAARRSGILGIVIGGIFMSLMAVLMAWQPDLLARVMTSDERVVAAAVPLLRVAAAFQVVDGIQVVATGALRGVGIVRWTLAANVLCYWIVGLPVAGILAYRFQLGAFGLWLGLTAAFALSALLLTARFLSVTRRRVVSLVSHFQDPAAEADKAG